MSRGIFLKVMCHRSSNGNLNEDVGAAKIREYVYFMETKASIEPDKADELSAKYAQSSGAVLVCQKLLSHQKLLSEFLPPHRYAQVVYQMMKCGKE